MTKEIHRLIIVTLFFVALSVVLIFSYIDDLLVWGVLIVVWFAAERIISPNVSLRLWHWVALIGGLYLLSYLVAYAA